MKRQLALCALCAGILFTLAASQANAQNVWRDEQRVARDDYQIYQDRRDIARDRLQRDRDIRAGRYFRWRERVAAERGNYGAAEYFRERKQQEFSEARREQRDIIRDRRELARDHYRANVDRARLRYDEGF
jgi:hypothetical protein